ncbi:MAG: SNF2 family DNA or RNA helicase [Alteromonadaceae bacterium]
MLPVGRNRRAKHQKAGVGPSPPINRWRSRRILQAQFQLNSGKAGLSDERIITQKIQLPTANATPLPSPELHFLFDENEPTQECTLKAWQVDCLILDMPLQALNQVHFLSQYQSDEYRLGSDFLFWYGFSRSIRQVIEKEHYLPTLLPYQDSKRKTAKSQLYKSWQIVCADFDNNVQQAVKQMPLVSSQGFEPHSLLSHFAQVTVNEHLNLCNNKVPQTVQKKFTDSIVEPFFDHDPQINPEAVLPGELEKWTSWHNKINNLSQSSAIQLCFRLNDASPDDSQNWSIGFLAAARHDLSFKQDLGDYWHKTAAQKLELEPLLGSDFEHQVLCALGSAARIYPQLWQGMTTQHPHSVRLSIDDAFAFLKETAWVLEDAGFKVIVPAWWTPEGRQRAKIRLRTKGSSGKGSADDGKGFLSFENLTDYSYELSIGDEPLSTDEWQQLLDTKSPLIKFRGQWMELEQDKMGHMLEFLRLHGDETPQASVSELIKTLAEQGDTFELGQNDALSLMLRKLSDSSAITVADNPKRLNANLREYQKRGLSWLLYLEELGLNGCLADDMGLGKTIQVIANLVIAQQQCELQGTTDGPTLLIAPTSVMGNWQKEVERFAPHLKTAIHHGSSRLKDGKEFKQLCLDNHMVITSYSLVRKDLKLFEKLNWQRVVLDEAQNIKNPKASQSKAIFKLKAVSRLALTGTPVENRLMDLWSIFHFLNPGYLGTQAQFRKTYEIPIQKQNSAGQSAVLKKLVGPFILRRMKTDKNIIKDLPDKVENKQYCNLSKEQAALYEAVVSDVTQQLAEKEGIERQGLMLSTLTRLKQICNHPMQYLQDNSEFTPERSHKLQRLGEMLEEAQADGDSVLIFTQFTEIGDQLVRYLSREKQLNCYYLHGGVSRTKRETMISEFQDPATSPSVFVLSLKAGGVGITLTRANHVFHFDRWWNPAVEDQATDRAFRIGQKKNVFVHKFITTGTLEERIDEMIEDKKQLAGSIVGSDEGWLSNLDNEAFKSLIALNKQAVME